MFQIEWEAIKSKLKIKGRQIIILDDDFSFQVDPKVLMGFSSSNYKIVLSKEVFKEYKKHIPTAKNRFTCADCGASFNHFHILSNHFLSESYIFSPIRLYSVSKIRYAN